MKKTFFVYLMICWCIGMNTPLGAKTVTYNFSSVEYWSTEPDGEAHPSTGTSALLDKIYYIGTNDCFVGTNDVYFNSGYLMLKPDAALKIPYKEGWPINKITLHAHSGGSTSVKVNIYNSNDGGLAASTALTWSVKDTDYEYVIKSSYQESALYIMVANSNNARITSVTIDYALSDDSDQEQEPITVSAPIFTPGSSTFSTESLKVTISAAEGCDIYYTTDGSEPSYTSVDEYTGTKGNVAIISSESEKTTLKAIAVEPTTGRCSNVSSATYTYVSVENNGTKTKPYTVKEIKAMGISTSKGGVYVKGKIYGTVYDGIDNLTTSNFKIQSNIVIGDSTGYIPIELPSGDDIRDNINLKDHPYLQGKEILVKGDLGLFYYNSLGLKNLKEYKEYQITYDVPINSYGYATLFLDIPASVPTGSTAYFCTIEEGYAKLNPVGTIVPDSMGVIIESEPNTTCAFTYTTQTNTNEDAIRKDNLLIGFTKDSVVAAGDAYYALNVKDNKLGFYIPQTATEITDATGGFTAKANKAYLRIPAEQKATMFLIRREMGETAIAPTSLFTDAIIYDLQGRSISNPTPGIYIRSGKKIIIR